MAGGWREDGPVEGEWRKDGVRKKPLIRVRNTRRTEARDLLITAFRPRRPIAAQSPHSRTRARKGPARAHKGPEPVRSSRRRRRRCRRLRLRRRRRGCASGRRGGRRRRRPGRSGRSEGPALPPSRLARAAAAPPQPATAAPRSRRWSSPHPLPHIGAPGRVPGPEIERMHACRTGQLVSLLAEAVEQLGLRTRGGPGGAARCQWR